MISPVLNAGISPDVRGAKVLFHTREDLALSGNYTKIDSFGINI